MDTPRIYLDNAATSWPKPEAVYAAVDRFQRELGAAAARGVYAEASEVTREVEAARTELARLLGVSDSRRFIFTFNGTDSLNLAIHGLLKPGDHVVTSVVEHNSVLRPLRRLEDQGRIQVTRVGVDGSGVVDADEIRHAMRGNTRLVALSHASNVTGAVQPVVEAGTIARDCGALFLVDAAQSLGHLPFDLAGSHASLLASSGHKGLLGPLGTGLLYVAPGIEELLDDVRQGGTGSQSEDDRQPQFLPDKYESGNLNALGIIGLGAGVQHLAEQGQERVRRHSVELTRQLIDGLSDIPGVRVFGPPAAENRVGVVSVAIEGYAPQEVAACLEAGCRIQVRAGLHCAPLMHRALGTLESGGTVRFSIGFSNTVAEIETAVEAVRQMTAATV